MSGRHGCPPNPIKAITKMARGPACYAEPLIFSHLGSVFFTRTGSPLLENALEHQPACKPGSVGHRPFARTIRDGHSSGTTFARCLEQPTRTASLTLLCGVFACANSPRCRPYSVLLPMGFAVPFPLPETRCALTAPFHPCLGNTQRTAAVCSLWHFPWGCPRRMLSGTVCRWSPDFPPPQPFDHSGSGRPAD